MKVRELIELLKHHQEDEEVVIGYNYGDYQQTEVFVKVTSVEELDAVFSEYFKAYTEEEDNPTHNFVSLKGE